MESQIAFSRTVMCLAAIALCGCITQAKTGHLPPARPVVLSIQQVGAAETSRFVYCIQEECNAVTPKTPALPQSVIAQSKATSATLLVPNAAEPPDDVSLEVFFAFNDSHINAADRDRIAMAAHKANAKTILINARSDFVGPPRQQQRIATARAAEIRKLIAANVSPKTRIAEALEIAAPGRVPDKQQAYQRRGTVRFLVSPQPSAGAKAS